ncbi:DUF1294 domain-containing protein [Glaciimonas sp. GG7]
MQPYSLSGSLSAAFTALFCIFLSAAAWLGWLPLTITAIYLATSTVAFIAYGVDKSAARKMRWRTKERTLLWLGFFGGWPGAFLAQKVFRHKSQKQAFQIVFWISVALNCATLGWMFTQSGSAFLQAVFYSST